MIRKSCDRVSCGRTPFRFLMKQWILEKILMRQGILLGNFLCDRVQGVQRFATHPRHFPSQVPPPPGYSCRNYQVTSNLRPRLHDIVFTSHRVGILFTSENGMKRIGLVRSRVNGRPIRYEMKTASCKRKTNPI